MHNAYKAALKSKTKQANKRKKEKKCNLKLEPVIHHFSQHQRSNTGLGGGTFLLGTSSYRFYWLNLDTTPYVSAIEKEPLPSNPKSEDVAPSTCKVFQSRTPNEP